MFICVPPDVIELSSGDEDTLRISSEEDNEDLSVTPGTEESSGSHVNDSLNQPDAQGRVLVNINHPGEEEDLFLAPQLARAVKPHQVTHISAMKWTVFRFTWTWNLFVDVSTSTFRLVVFVSCMITWWSL